VLRRCVRDRRTPRSRRCVVTRGPDRHGSAIARILASIPPEIRFSVPREGEPVVDEPEPTPVAVHPVQRSLFEMETNDGQ
jgi:hypothetical protein